MLRSEEGHAADGCCARNGRDDQQWNVLDGLDNHAGGLVLQAVGVVVLDGFSDRGKGSWEEQEAGEEEPDEEGGEGVVQEGYVVHSQEHSDIAGLMRVAALALQAPVFRFAFKEDHFGGLLIMYTE